METVINKIANLKFFRTGVLLFGVALIAYVIYLNSAEMDLLKKQALMGLWFLLPNIFFYFRSKDVLDLETVFIILAIIVPQAVVTLDYLIGNDPLKSIGFFFAPFITLALIVPIKVLMKK